MPTRTKSLLSKVVALWKELNKPIEFVKSQAHPISSEAGSLLLVDQAVGIYEEIVNGLLNDETLEEKFTAGSIVMAFDELIVRLRPLTAQEDVKREFMVFLETLEGYSTIRTIFLPVVGIGASENELEVGNIKFVNMNGPDADILIQRIGTLLEESPGSAQSSLLKNQIAGKVCAKFTAVAEMDRAQERAEDESRRVMDIFRYASSVLYPQHEVGARPLPGLLGEVMTIPRISPAISGDGQYAVSSRLIGSPMKLELTQQNIENMKKVGVFDLADLLKKKARDLNDFEEALLRGVHWFGNSQAQAEPENRLLSLVTCLEAYLTPKDGSPIGAAIGEGTALLVAEGVENRKQVKKFVRDRYRERSAVSHGGKTSVPEIYLGRLERLARNLTTQLIKWKDRFQSRSDLLDWVESKKFESS